MGKNVIYVYETKAFRLLNKNPIKVANITDFSWSPTDPILAAYVPELSGGNQPARVIMTSSDLYFQFILIIVHLDKIINILFVGESFPNPKQTCDETENSLQC